MQATLASYADRMWERRQTLLTALCITVAAVLLAGASAGWSLVVLLGALGWAALWPAAPDRATTGSFKPQLDTAQADSLEAARSPSQPLPLSLLAGLPDAALVLDARGLVIAGNTAAQSIAPIPVGRPLSHWLRAPELLAAAESAIASQTQQRSHVRLYSPVERSLDVIVTPAASDDGRTGRVLLITLRDLTEQEQLSRMRMEFVANASHELRTPLASLRGFVETLQDAAKNDPAAQARFLGIMQTQAERMSRLIEDLLSLSRIEMREHVAPTAFIDLAVVVGDAVAALRPHAEKAGVFLDAPQAIGRTMVTGDRDELMQVAQNLIQNAIKYGRKGGKVEISIGQQDRLAILKVVDDGIGIAPEHLPRLTERFYRVSAKDSKERGGTGLGLAIVKHIVNRHRGELRIFSTLGKGSTFAVALPMAPAAD